MKQRAGLFLSIVALLLGIVPALWSLPVSAQSSDRVEVIDKVYVRFRGETYKDKNPYDGTNEWRVQVDCGSIIRIDNFSGSNPVARVELKANSATGNCSTTDEINNVALTNPAQRFIQAYRLDSNNVFFPVGFTDPGCSSNKTADSIDNSKTSTFRRAPSDDPDFDTNTYYQVRDGEPLWGEHKFVTSSTTAGTVELDDSRFSCPYHEDYEIRYGALTAPAREQYDLAEAGPSSRTSTSTSSEEDDSCESKSGPLGWIMCPVILAIDGGLNWVDSRINELLEVDSGYYDNTDMRNAAANIRNVAYLILVPVMLVMVISTALGFEFISAYTVKKALPRLIAAAIFISISYPLLTFFIEFIDAVGKGTAGIIMSPFETRYGELTLASLFEGNIFTGIITGIGGAVAFILILWLFGGTILLFAAMAFFILLLRQMFVVALLLMAPLAILAWIFPGNDKLWGAWWHSFSKLLFMYPIIMAVIAIGRVFAFIIDKSNPAGLDGAVLAPIMTIVAYTIPYAFIPFTFKLAGGMFATLAGVANDRGKGVFDKQRAKRAENWAGFKGGTKAPPGFRGNHVGARGMQRLGTGVGVGWKGRGGFGNRGRQALDQNARQSSIDQVMKSSEWNGVNQNDDALHAATYSTAREAQANLTNRFRSSLQNDVNEGTITSAEADMRAQARSLSAVRAVQASVGFGQPQAIAAAQQLVSTGTGYDDLQDMTKTLERASGGNRGTASALAGFANAETKKVGRFDLAPGFQNLDKMVRSAGGMADIGEDAPTAEKATEASWNSGSLYSISNGKSAGTKTFAKHWVKQYDQALASGDTEALIKAESARQEFKAMLPNAIGDNATVINDALATFDKHETEHVARLAPTDAQDWSVRMDTVKKTAEQRARTYDRNELSTRMKAGEV